MVYVNELQKAIDTCAADCELYGVAYDWEMRGNNLLGNKKTDYSIRCQENKFELIYPGNYMFGMFPSLLYAMRAHYEYIYI